ncbi:hypothetical protein [Methanolobus halotolerans]|uniref:Uncharacterized protein n=1 Tax=Methanolobus halotolerans TaxID=2052935 RepID=A0A4E0QDF0_9EURY|nr:hypothetical protein [Methanolobus halotolerans]TGC11401.1 hypothetical protein CUN85_00520 [Methanolobus halotolerans]
MQYNRYLLAGVILLMLVLLIMFADSVSGPAKVHMHSESVTYLKTDTLSKAVLISLPPAIAGFYILTRHRMKRTGK